MILYLIITPMTNVYGLKQANLLGVTLEINVRKWGASAGPKLEVISLMDQLSFFYIKKYKKRKRFK